MTPKNILQAVRDRLRTLTFLDSAELVFAQHVYAVPETPAEQITRICDTRMAFVIERGEVSHPEHLGLRILNFAITIFYESYQSEFGEQVVIGNTVRRSAKDVEAAIVRSLEDATVIGTKINFEGKGVSSMSSLSGNFPIVFKTLEFSAFAEVYN